MEFFNSAVTTLQTIVVGLVFGAASTFWKVTVRITRPASRRVLSSSSRAVVLP